MRMKNPFSDEPGDEESGAAETRAGQMRESEQPDHQPDDQAEVSEARADEEAPSADSADEPDSNDEPESTADEPGSGDDSEGGTGKEKAGITAPSIGPDTVIERTPPEERLDFDKISDTDAMGEDKRREVVGGTYGPTRTRVLGTFAAFIAGVAVLAVGFYLLAKELDQPPAENPDVSPWSQAEAPQQPPRPLQ